MAPIFVIEEKEKISFYMEHSPLLVLYASKIPGAEYCEEDNRWTASYSQRSLIIDFCKFCIKRNLASEIVDIDGKDSIHQIFADRMPTMELPSDAPFKPYDYQLKGMKYALDHKRTFFGDDMGLGKTFQAVGACWLAKSYPVLVACPLAMKETWRREFERWTQKRCLIIDDEHRYDWWRYVKTGSYYVVIVNYESLKKYFISRVRGGSFSTKNIIPDVHASMFRTVIIDESHNVKESSSQSSKILEKLCLTAEYIFLLSGTPIVLGNEDLIQQLKIMRRMDDFGGVRRFKERYCQDKASNMAELNMRLWQTCFFRRDKSLVLKDLPEKTRQFLEVEISNRQEYNVAEEDLVQYLRKYVKASRKQIRKSMRGEMMVKISCLRQIAARGKMHVAIPFIHDVIDGGNKLIVFVFHKTVTDEIRKFFPDVVTVTGSDTAEQKQKAIDRFQNDPTCKLIVVNYRSGGCGVTLTAATRELFIELPWTCADCEQSEARAHRNGQKNAVNCYYIIGKDTVDEKIYEVIEKERMMAKTVIGSRDDAREINDIEITMKIFKKKIEQ